MPALVRKLAIALAVVWCGLLFSPATRAQTPAASSDSAPTGTITGRLTSEEKPSAGIVVTLLPNESGGPRAKAVARTTTDGDGRYTLRNIPAGRYAVLPIAPVYVIETQGRSWQPRTSVNIAAGETVEGIDFTLVRGGVITGRVTDAEGRPVVAQYVQASPVSEGNEQNRGGRFARPRMTDDRGVYRLYGLAPGRYYVSVGEDDDNMRFFGGAGRLHYPRTFYPNVGEEARAKMVEVTSDGEATDIDITLGASRKTYRVLGRVAQAGNNQPVAGVRIMFGALQKSSNQVGGVSGGHVTDARGEFRIDGIVPGRYALFTDLDNQSDMYSEQVTFEVADADVNNVVVEMKQGTSVSGVVAVEGSNERAALPFLSRFSIFAYPETRAQQPMFNSLSSRINADGSFHIRGIRPGKVRLGLGGVPEVKGFMLLRVERNGAAMREGIDLTSGMPATGVRVVLAYGNSVVRGQVRAENGVLPPDSRMIVMARRLDGGASTGIARPLAEVVDARGHFVFDGLAPGEYELTLNVFISGRGRPQTQNPKQRIMVGASGETPVTFVLNLREGEPEAKQGEPEAKP